MIKKEYLLIFLIFISCGYYSFTGESLPGIKTVAIPMFENQTLEYGIAESLTDSLVSVFVSDNTLKVVDEKVADSILRGSIKEYQRIAHTYDQDEEVKEYKVRIFVDVTFEAKKKKETIWEKKDMEGWGVYSAIPLTTSAGLDSVETEDSGKARAVKKLADDILNNIVKGW
ncbi:MAG: hypothetical protein AMJ90_07665 [candidate division Zixibacteria bacterium SM23_73_2]|nr:MAG: hypothetical protein AMJ90_07665 [candidate division Zixibacteria bacterium SM23_73_2]